MAESKTPTREYVTVFNGIRLEVDESVPPDAIYFLPGSPRVNETHEQRLKRCGVIRNISAGE